MAATTVAKAEVLPAPTLATIPAAMSAMIAVGASCGAVTVL